jgi:Mn2+/Fe2+ NRAMP family transporter
MTADERIEAERRTILRARQRGKLATMGAYVRLSGPGWLQSALTLGGGTLASSLYLGVLAGVSLLWLQPVAMILGIIMLSAVGYVTMSTRQRPLQAIQQHLNPVLAWAWALGSLAASMVWALPQFSLANSVFQHNLLRELYSAEQGLGPENARLLVSLGILLLTVLITWAYGSGHWGVKLYEWMLKLMVAAIVVCFFIVVYTLLGRGTVAWTDIAVGFVPRPQSLFEPAAAFAQPLQEAGAYGPFWSKLIVSLQQDRVAAAAAATVGINMTFLFAYSILRRGWDRTFRGLQVFDLATGMLIPFVLATSCVIIASAAAFHGQAIDGLVHPGLDAQGNPLPAAQQPNEREVREYRELLKKRLQEEIGPQEYQRLASGQEAWQRLEHVLPAEQLATLSPREREQLRAHLGEMALAARVQQLPEADRRLAAMLVERDANRLAQALAPLAAGDAPSSAGPQVPQDAAPHGMRWTDVLFGLGVIGMTLSSITLQMLISGFVLCELFRLPQRGWSFRLCCLPAAVGVLGPFIWSKAGFALAIPTSIFGFMLLPIAYVTFFLLMNQRSLLGEELPRGRRRVAWNLLMVAAVGITTTASVYMIYKQTGVAGLYAYAVLIALALLAQVWRWTRPPVAADDRAAT